MEYVYAALLLHATKQNITEAGIAKVIKAASAEADSSRVKALIAALEGVDIEEAIKATPIAAAPVPAATESAPVAVKEEEEEEEEEGEDLGLASLFG